MRAALLALVLAFGCIPELDPQTGAAIAARCVDDDTDTGAQVSYARDIQPIFDLRCKSCHFPTGVSPVGLQATGLDLSSLARLKAGDSSGQAVVVAGQPCGSILFEKVGPGPPFGSRMPLSGPPFLTDEQLQLIHDWIAEGALAN